MSMREVAMPRQELADVMNDIAIGGVGQGTVNSLKIGEAVGSPIQASARRDHVHQAILGIGEFLALLGSHVAPFLADSDLVGGTFSLPELSAMGVRESSFDGLVGNASAAVGDLDVIRCRSFRVFDRSG